MQPNMMVMTERIWCAYNHIPGGQIVVTHFETYSRKKKLGDNNTEEVVFKAQDQLENFKKSDFVALKMKDKELEKNKVLVYPDSSKLPEDPAGTVIEWAKSQGMEPFFSPSDRPQEATLSDASLKIITSLQHENVATKLELEELKAKLDLLIAQKTSAKPQTQPPASAQGKG